MKKAPGPEVRGVRRQAEPDRQLQHLERAGQGAPDAVAYVGPGSQAAVSLTRIQSKSGQKLLVGACDLDQVAMQGVKDGLVKALISPEHWMKGYIAIKLLADAKREGKDVPEGVWNSGELTVNKKNIDEILARQQTRRAARTTSSRRSTSSSPTPKYLGQPGNWVGAGSTRSP